MKDPVSLAQFIHRIRGQRVMLSGNLDRFPIDFCFQLSSAEFAHLKSQIVTSSWGGARRAYPYAFTEQGVAMLSSVLRSKKAIHANISIMRAFVKIREIGAQNRAILRKLNALEQRVDRNDADIGTLIDSIREETAPATGSRRRIGFHQHDPNELPSQDSLRIG